MKHTLITLSLLTTISVILYAVFNNPWLLVGLFGFGLALLVLGAYFFGARDARQSMQLGANIAIQAQQVNDKWDAAKMAGLANFGKEVIKIKTDSIMAGQQYPALPPMTAIDGSFTIAGLNDDDEVTQ